jgi:hypothetical protein
VSEGAARPPLGGSGAHFYHEPGIPIEPGCHKVDTEGKRSGRGARPPQRPRRAIFTRMLLALALACSPGTSSPAPADTAASDDSGATDSGISDSAEDSAADGDSAADTGPRGDPNATGLAGGWTIEHDDTVAGAVFIHPVDTDKDGAIVAARVASALGGRGIRATSDSRAVAVTATRMADAAYVDDVTDFIVDDLYGAFAGAGQVDSPLLINDTLVLTSVHRYGLYVAEALHAPVLPLQILSFASSWEQIEAAATRATIIAGQDAGYDGVWLWNKLAAGTAGTPAGTLPDAYLRALASAKRVVLVQPDDNWTTCTDSYCHDVISDYYDGATAPIWMHSSLSRSGAYAQALAEGRVHPAPDADVANLKQWEWGVPDSTVANVRAAWAALGKDPADFVVIRGGVVDMFAWSPWLWRAYLAHNGVVPRGFHFLSYWAAFPALERAGAALPIPSYSYWQDDWHPLDDNARALIAEVCGGNACEPSFAAGTRAFVNTIGSTAEERGVRDVLTDFQLSPDAGGWYGFGINAEGASGWTGWDGETVADGWEQAAADLQDPAKAPYADRAWAPLAIEAICGLGLHTCE